MCTSFALLAYLVLSFVLFALPAAIFVSTPEIKLALGIAKPEEFQCSRHMTRTLIINILKNSHNLEFESWDLNQILQVNRTARAVVTNVVKRVVWGMVAYVITGTWLAYSFWTSDAANEVSLFCA